MGALLKAPAAGSQAFSTKNKILALLDVVSDFYKLLI